MAAATAFEPVDDVSLMAELQKDALDKAQAFRKTYRREMRKLEDKKEEIYDALGEDS